MTYYLIEPKDPLIIRASRPFEAITDEQAARFPPPSTVGGALRNLCARSNQLALNEALLSIAVTGPLAIKLSVLGKPATEADILVPKPADAQYFSASDASDDSPCVTLVRLQPQALSEDEGCDLLDGLQPVLPETLPDGKPVSGPVWWALTDLMRWRKRDKTLTFKQIQANGWQHSSADIRTHIEMDNKKRVSADGQIFQTAGLTLWDKATEGTALPSHKIALIAGIEKSISTDGQHLKSMVNLGGERRLAAVSACDIWPKKPQDLSATIIAKRGLTLTFVTPAIFKHGWLPDWIDPSSLTGSPPNHPSLTLRLVSAALEPWLPQSGWDLAKNQPRATQKMIPAGAVYWFEILSEPRIEEVDALWMSHLGDDAQNNRNGFNLVLPFAYHVNQLNEF